MLDFASFIAESSRSGIELDPTPPDDFTHREQDDDYFYHVTLRRNVKQILRFGLAPCKGPTMCDGFYRSYSRGKVFFCDRSGVSYWIGVVERHLQDQTDEYQIPKLAVVRFPKGLAKDYQKDEIGVRDSAHSAYFSAKPIKAL